MNLLTKIGLYVGATFILTILLAGIQQITGLDPQRLSLPQWGPGIIAIAMVLTFKQDGVRLNLSVQAAHTPKYLIALALPVTVALLLYLIYSQFIGPIGLPPFEFPALMLLFGGILLGALGEELGWRGYAQNLLDRHLAPLVGTLIIGVIWGVWHVGNFQYGALHMLFFVLGTIGISLFIRWLIEGAQHSVILATAVHFAINAGYYILGDALTDTRLMILNGIVWLGIGVAVV
ncbi:MAG: CPBP family intramembrane glutamic endopeptidase, partial [Chloroflexota bacterium]